MTVPPKVEQLAPAANVLTFLSRSSDKAAVERVCVDRHVVVPCASATDAIAALRAGRTAALVWDISTGRGRECADMLQRATREGLAIPRLLVLFDVGRFDARSLLGLVAVTRDLQVSLRRVDDVASDLTILLAAKDRGTPEGSILRRFLQIAITPALQVVIAALLVGKQRTSVRAFAKLLGVPMRTLQSRLNSVGLPTAEDLLGWAVSLWTEWRTEVLRLPLKNLLAASHFTTMEAQASYVARHVGARPHQLAVTVGFEELLDRFMAMVLPAVEES